MAKTLASVQTSLPLESIILKSANDGEMKRNPRGSAIRREGMEEERQEEKEGEEMIRMKERMENGAEKKAYLGCQRNR